MMKDTLILPAYWKRVKDEKVYAEYASCCIVIVALQYLKICMTMIVLKLCPV